MNRFVHLFQRAFFGVAFLVVARSFACADNVSAPGSGLCLWYTKPAGKWDEALPIGNGRMGAMFFGGVASERIQFNEDTLWTGKPHDYARPDAHTHLAEIRRLIASGQDEAAKKLVREKFLSVPLRQKAYQPFGDIRIVFPAHEVFTDYRRELDLQNAVARVGYRIGNVVYRREVFASYPAQAVIVKISADKKQAISFSLKLDSPHKVSRSKPVAPDTLLVQGQVQEDGLGFEARVLVQANGGRISITEAGIAVEAADSVTLILVAATSFRNFQDISADPAARCEADLAQLRERTYEELLAEHVADYRALFGRVSLDLGRNAQADKPTDQRQRELKMFGLEKDPALASLFFQYGRYLLIASSRPGSRPANLQGVWNELLDPPWESKWTTNINAEMNYWPAEVTNLGECHEPLFDLTADVATSGARTAKSQYGYDGWVLHHNTDLWCGTAPINNIDGVWPTGGAWLCHHLWEHHQFTGDKRFLANRAYPLFKGASRFFLDYLVKDEKTGWLVTTPSFSPEQGGLCAGPTMDTQLVRALFDYTIEAARILKKDTDFISKVKQARSQLPPDLIGRHGQLQEWLEDVDRPNNNHRHMSPLWALYPGNDITPANEKVFAAAKTLLKWRGDGSTGWSFAWRIPLWARVGDGDFAFRQLNLQLTKRTLPNLFDLCGPFQIDGNFGAAAGIAEMLLQSHQRTAGLTGTVVIELLPAVPKVWRDGTVVGLCARDGFEVDITWRDASLTRVAVRSKLGRPCILRNGVHEIRIDTEMGKSYLFDGSLARTDSK
ncbi:MAG: glycoside hydrolase family 95 protein [Nibricoccus sp.]